MSKLVPDWEKIRLGLRAYLERTGLTQAALANRFGVDPTQISNIGRGVRRSPALTREMELLLKDVMGGEIPYVDGEIELAPLDPGLDMAGEIEAPPKLALVSEPDQNDPRELQRALHLVRQLHKLKTHRPPYREHDWKVLMALLEAPEESDRDRKRGRKE